MRAVWSLLFAALLAAPPLSSSLPPTPAALRRAVAASAPAVVEVSGPEGRGAGIVVGTGGEVLTSVRFVALDKARLRAQKEQAQGRVIAASASLGTAIVLPERTLPTRSIAVRPAMRLTRGGWLIAVGRARAERPFGVRILSAPPDAPFVQLAAPLAPGTALLDDQGALVALVVRSGRGRCTAARLAAVKAQLAQAGAR